MGRVSENLLRSLAQIADKAIRGSLGGIDVENEWGEQVLALTFSCLVHIEAELVPDWCL